MSKYQPLSDRLSAHPHDEWRASFAEIEEVLGFPLPKKARSGSGWWANDPEKGAGRAWTGAGWSVGDLDWAGESVVFRRAGAPAAPPAPAPQPPSKLRKAAPIVAGVAGAAVAAGVAALVARKVRRRNAEALKSSGPS
jgi:hypothetical protein